MEALNWRRTSTPPSSGRLISTDVSMRSGYTASSMGRVCILPPTLATDVREAVTGFRAAEIGLSDQGQSGLPWNASKIDRVWTVPDRVTRSGQGHGCDRTFGRSPVPQTDVPTDTQPASDAPGHRSVIGAANGRRPQMPMSRVYSPRMTCSMRKARRTRSTSRTDAEDL